MKTLLYLFYGGKSVEYEVSLKTAFTALQSIDLHKYTVYPIHIARDGRWSCSGALERAISSIEELTASQSGRTSVAASIGQLLSTIFNQEGKKVVLPMLHGTGGEDGTLQGMMELLDIPYVGNGVLSSAMALDKAVCKTILQQAGIAQIEHLTYSWRDWKLYGEQVSGQIEQTIGYPCYVKPASLGSSVGISRCQQRSELDAALSEAFRFDRKIVVERDACAREIQVAVMGNDHPAASWPGEFIHEGSFFHYEAKYLDPQLQMSIPADLPASITEQIRETAVKAYTALGCSGLARVDFFVDGRQQIYLNEINTMPGFTNCSMYPVMWERTNGTSYGELIERLIDYALERHLERQSIEYAR
ncbi:D-alanine--D-alanine ligase family protein [Paenibacillus sp. GCM10027626]|uniref:D-alanine--D-alanine ligase family protein n=1 Tax=Paenibacillus sp. GCM10027626 TaxID=3273411 RepID=UPI00362835B5